MSSEPSKLCAASTFWTVHIKPGKLGVSSALKGAFTGVLIALLGLISLALPDQASASIASLRMRTKPLFLSLEYPVIFLSLHIALRSATCTKTPHSFSSPLVLRAAMASSAARSGKLQ